MSLSSQTKIPSLSKKDARKDVEAKLEALFIADKKTISDKKFKKAIKKAGKIITEALVEETEVKAPKAAKKAAPAPKKAVAKKTTPIKKAPAAKKVSAAKKATGV